MSRQQTLVGLPDLCVTASALPQSRREIENDGNQPPANADRSPAVGFEDGLEVAVFEQVHRECATLLNDLNLFSEHNPGRLTVQHTSTPQYFVNLQRFVQHDVGHIGHENIEEHQRRRIRVVHHAEKNLAEFPIQRVL